ncbi:MAG TPA: hypothetical protein DEF41_10620 [Desulfovibrio sp.]|uniref:Uncharacterized protein n=1 Tax=Nitratidesulfovibrio vulgaris (strain ATCC 29579 / DSM 644 / CCUG 34227 / NCIMB 8303 / VKM B-1760 / Hildenborough) TaxID=882 RepID=Q72CV5_NITV2|nr:hypothetical protein DVU_1178 [Nitratidesulfovibrio vulgaris str. Hildenborough]HBW16557.1 hypothetical protein [Desulfovibrio sp.]
MWQHQPMPFDTEYCSLYYFSTYLPMTASSKPSAMPYRSL